ncbi:glycerophosphodiester phosphodiesterase [Chloroflexi bacterium TSY]|nr:glycerophosphodiester phosphodiesterase [Chloroflexi bacterium TSY]
MTKQSLIFAHRGAREAAPENTLPAFAKALEMGVDGIELDVQCSSDGELVVIHDFDVDKTTNGVGPVSQFAVAELLKLDAGSHFDPAYSDIRIPRFVDVLDLVQDRCIINVEIKSRDAKGGPEVEPLVELIQTRNLYEQVIVSSFNPPTLIKMRWTDPKVSLGLLYFEPLPSYLQKAWFSPIIAPEALHPHHTLIDQEWLGQAKADGYSVNTWTVNDLDEAQRLAKLGVDVIMTDVPDQLLAKLRSIP